MAVQSGVSSVAAALKARTKGAWKKARTVKAESGLNGLKGEFTARVTKGFVGFDKNKNPYAQIRFVIISDDEDANGKTGSIAHFFSPPNTAYLKTTGKTAEEAMMESLERLSQDVQKLGMEDVENSDESEMLEFIAGLDEEKPLISIRLVPKKDKKTGKEDMGAEPYVNLRARLNDDEDSDDDESEEDEDEEPAPKARRGKKPAKVIEEDEPEDDDVDSEEEPEEEEEPAPKPKRGRKPAKVEEEPEEDDEPAEEFEEEGEEPAEDDEPPFEDEEEEAPAPKRRTAKAAKPAAKSKTIKAGQVVMFSRRTGSKPKEYKVRAVDKNDGTLTLIDGDGNTIRGIDPAKVS